MSKRASEEGRGADTAIVPCRKRASSVRKDHAAATAHASTEVLRPHTAHTKITSPIGAALRAFCSSCN